jgi:hypothetical protein
MTEGPRSRRVEGRAKKAARPGTQASKRARRKQEELGPERRVQLAQQIEAKRLRGKPPSI